MLRCKQMLRWDTKKKILWQHKGQANRYTCTLLRHTCPTFVVWHKWYDFVPLFCSKYLFTLRQEFPFLGHGGSGLWSLRNIYLRSSVWDSLGAHQSSIVPGLGLSISWSPSLSETCCLLSCLLLLWDTGQSVAHLQMHPGNQQSQPWHCAGASSVLWCGPGAGTINQPISRTGLLCLQRFSGVHLLC